MKLFLAVILGIFSVVCADGSIDLTDSDFDKLKSYDVALVMFYAPWCGHCKRLKPEFEKAASDLMADENPVHLVKVDCTEGGKDACGKHGVSGYPTLKIFRNGDLSSDYNGPREANGIVKFMRGQAGPASRELKSVADAEKFLKVNEVAVVHFGEGSLKDAFTKVADKMRETVRFGHTTDAGVSGKYGFKDTIVLFRSPVLKNKFEPSEIKYEGSANKADIEKFIKDNFHGLVGHRTPDVAQDFKNPLVVAYFKVDYQKNAKGTNYWRNRVLKIAQDFKDDFTFAISSVDEFQHELNEYGIDHSAGDKVIVGAKGPKGEKYVMKEDFSMDEFKKFLTQLKAGELESYLKSEDVPDNEGAPVKVAVAKNFEELVTNSGRDALIEFYAPWCGHCKKLTPVYDELGEKLAGEDVDIIKMDATANDVPSDFNVRGFPTLFWRPKGGAPVSYDGGRELDDFISYIAKHATEELKGYDRKGKDKKTEL